ncbi:MAG: methylmalonyl-CoA epimerase [candidate division Zixibacteria bacterium]|nr:methylmalonyl-CoA epimerase [candidate division Zixibacteria bacterium]
MKPSIRHIAIAVRDIEPAKQLYAGILNVSMSETTDVPDQKVRICFIQLANARIELISPMTGNLSLTRFLDKHGEVLHHICLGVADIAAELARLQQQGARLIDEQARVGAGGHKIAFVHPKSTSGVLIELEEV